MSSFVRGLRLLLALTGLLALLIVLPAILFGAIGRWQVAFLASSYFCFFLGAVWRVFRYGELASRREDEQVKSRSGRLAFAVQVIGLLAVHWLALYDFSRQDAGEAGAWELLSVTVAIFMIAASILINQVAIRTLGEFFDRLTIKTDHQLVTAGIYSAVRHPIYLSYILLFAGFCAMLGSPVSFGLLVAVCAVWFGSRIAIEEEMLEREFGEEYRAYRQKTKKLVPFVY